MAQTEADVYAGDVFVGIDDDEEKARAIAGNDLQGPRKQATTGVIYGDIGTSPLYVYSSTFSSQPSWQDLVGALSIIIWSLTLIVTAKYCFIVLSADDNEQGGTFALYSLLARYTDISRRDPRDVPGIRLQRFETGDLKAGGKSLRGLLEKSRTIQFFLQFIGVLGVSMVMADGVLTPAQSVLGAIQGIKVINPDLGTSAIVGISYGILVILFLIQPFGTSKIGTMFAPVVVIWLPFNLYAGIYNLAVHDYTVLKAFSPHFAFSYLVRNGHEGWKSLGGLLLAFTGVEALFADLGAFSKRAVQLSWMCLAYPCLLIAYVGQAAYISHDETKQAFTNPFFNTVPPGSLYFLGDRDSCSHRRFSSYDNFNLSTSHSDNEALILSSVYMPMGNWLLMTGTVIITAVYNNTTSLGNAYGVCVITVTFITTCMVSLVAILVWRLPAYIVVPLWLVFASLDAAFLSAVYEKVPDGAWFTLLLAFILSYLFTLWRFGKECQWQAESHDQLSPQALLLPTTATKGTVALSSTFDGTPISTVPGLGIFFDKSGIANSLPPSFFQFVIKFAARPAVVVLFNMRPLPVPTVTMTDRYVIRHVSEIDSCYAVTLRHGYTDSILYPGLAQDIVQQIVLSIARGRRNNTTDAELDLVQSSRKSPAVYILGKETIKIGWPSVRSPKAYLRSWLLWIFLWFRENSRTKLADIDIDADKVIEVGFIKEL
ncbi:potassium uptake [Fusarium subglutinans]|uniref:Potassium uptake n=1 Tax=Gibberella subglutinans TaxID=42677 RepID=A0A8H5UNH0_GIBSU|nr:potassium uptake [Fusarium subglutinans]KAF5592010.1 potassium uptake [Fusarium subglutinans]